MLKPILAAFCAFCSCAFAPKTSWLPFSSCLIFASSVAIPRTPGANPVAGPSTNPPDGVTETSLENSPGAQPFPARTLK